MYPPGGDDDRYGAYRQLRPNPLLTSLLPPLLAHYPQRIAQHNGMTNLIAWSLLHLSDPSKSGTPFVLHTLPRHFSAGEKVPEEYLQPLLDSPQSIPKLISIAEIIRRSYVPPVGEAPGLDKGKGKGPVVGLHQYVRIGALEELGVTMSTENEEEKSERIAKEWVESGGGGRKRPRRKHTPYMIIVLSPVPIPELALLASYTHEPPRPPAKIPSPKATPPAPVKSADDPLSPDHNTSPPEGSKRSRKRKKKGGATKEKEKNKDVEMEGPILPPDLSM